MLKGEYFHEIILSNIQAEAKMIESGQKYKKRVEKHVIPRKHYDEAMTAMWKVFFQIKVKNYGVEYGLVKL